MSFSYAALKSKTEEELIAEHDKEAKLTVAGVSYYLDELARRDANRVNKSMLKCTRWITIMTLVMLLGTIVNVVINIVD